MSAANLSRTAVGYPARVWAADSTAAAYTDPAATVTKPSGNGVADVARNFGQVANDVELIPFGTGTAGQTFNLRVHGWRKTSGSGLWVPVTLCEVACTLGTKVGVAGQDVLATNKFCDTITLVFGVVNTNLRILSPTGNLFASLLFDLQGCQLFQADVKVVDATSGNALWAGV